MKIAVVGGKGVVGLNLLEKIAFHTETENTGICIDLGDSYDPIEECEIVVVCLPTPVVCDIPDTHVLDSAMGEIAARVRADTLVILESTVGIWKPRELSHYLPCPFAYSPERINPGALRQSKAKLVAGASKEATARASAFYRSIGYVPHVVSLEVAAAAKLLENTYRAVNIALANEMLQILHPWGINTWDVVDAANTKGFGFQAFYPGYPGGHCIPVDPYYLLEDAADAHLITEAMSVNKNVIQWIMTEARRRLGVLRKKQVLIIGMTYKPDVADSRNSAGYALLERLRDEMVCVSIVDPMLNYGGALSDMNYFDLIILLQAHKGTDLERLRLVRHKVIDMTGELR